MNVDFTSVIEKENFDKTAWSISHDLAFSSSMVPHRLELAKKKYDSSHIKSINRTDVEKIINKYKSFKELPKITESEFKILLSPKADFFLEEIATIAKRINKQRFGNTISLYAPLYLSNTCKSTCTYCGFSFENKIRRLTLTLDQIEAEAEILHKQGIRHLLLLTGESYADTPLSYLKETIDLLQKKFSSISIEVYPLDTDDYIGLRASGLDGLAVYQETYDPIRYAEVHLRGMKKRMQYRLECPDRAGQAGLHKIVIGALAGLSDPAADVYFTGLHARYLALKYWGSHISVSLPRLRPASGLAGQQLPIISDRDYVRYLCVLRIFLPDSGLFLSTREPAKLRDSLASICITNMSAGSKTQPGGYTGQDSDEQFQISDIRSIEQTSHSISKSGMQPVFTDWSALLK